MAAVTATTRESAAIRESIARVNAFVYETGLAPGPAGSAPPATAGAAGDGLAETAWAASFVEASFAYPWPFSVTTWRRTGPFTRLRSRSSVSSRCSSWPFSGPKYVQPRSRNRCPGFR